MAEDGLSKEELIEALEGLFGNDPDAEFVLGDPSTTGELRRTLNDPQILVDNIQSILSAALISWGNTNGYQRQFMEGIFGNGQSSLNNLVQGVYQEAAEYEANLPPIIRQELATGQMKYEEVRGTVDWWNSAQGLAELSQRVWAQVYYGLFPEIGPDIYGIWTPPTTSGGGGGGGSRLPTREEILQRYDINQLAEGVQQIWRGMLLEEHEDPRGLAQKYLDQVIASNGQQSIDFTTFVRSEARTTTRHASLYANKPEHLAEEAYISPYLQAASSVLRPRNVPGVAIGGAQFGASPEAFEQRLQRTDEVTGSAPFINQLEARMHSVSRALRG